MEKFDRSPAADGRRCFLCGGSNFKLLHSWAPREGRNGTSIPLGIWQCECRVVFLHPVPTPDQLPGAGDWWSNERKQFTRRRGLKRFRRAIRRWALGSVKQRLMELTRRAVPSGRLLDVGCGKGDLMQKAAAYYECIGLEPSAQAVAETRQNGFAVIEGTFENAAIEAESFDVVTMDSVIEHLADPLLALKQAHRVLKPNGVVVLKTPKMWGPAYRIHRKEWNGFRLGYHTFLFDGKTLGKTLAEAGFSVLDSPKRDRLLDDVLILWGRKHSVPVGSSK